MYSGLRGEQKMTRASFKVAIVVTSLLAMVVATAGVSNAAKSRKVQQVTSISKAVEKSFIVQNRTPGKESPNACLRRQAKYEASRSAKRGKGFYRVNRSKVAKKCGLAHVRMVFVKQSSKSTKSSVVKRVRRTAEYKRSIRSSKHKVYGASTYRDKKVKGRTYTVLFAGQRKPVVKKPTPPPVVPTKPTPVPTTPAPTTVPTSEPTTAPTTVPTTEPTSEPTTVPTTPAPAVPVAEDPTFIGGTKDWIRHEMTIPGPSGWVNGDACVATLADTWARNAASARTLTGIPSTVTSCGTYNETLVLTGKTDAWPSNPPLTVAKALLGATTGPTTSGPRNIGDALAASSGRVALSVYRLDDGSRWAVAAVTFDHPRYTPPVRDTTLEQQTINAMIAKTDATNVNVQTPDDCITAEIDARAKTIATGQTDPDQRQWTTTNLTCPNLYKQFYAYSPGSTADQIADDLTSGTLRQDSGTTAKDRIAYALTHEEGRLVVRTYRDYRGRVWTYTGVVLDDQPYREPRKVAGFEQAVRDQIVNRSVQYADGEREAGFWRYDDPAWTEAEECFQNAVNTWALQKAADKSKNKSVYAAFTAGDYTSNKPGLDNNRIMWGGKHETFASTGCDTGYAKGFVLASNANTPAGVASEFFDEYTTEIRGVFPNRRDYAKNWFAESTVAHHLGQGYKATVRSFEDFRGDVWTYAVFAGAQGDTRRLDTDQIEQMKNATVQKVNDYRAAQGLPRLPRRDCMDRLADGSNLFFGSYFLLDENFSGSMVGSFVHLNEADFRPRAARYCDEPDTAASEIITQTSVVANERTQAFNTWHVDKWVDNWKKSASHNGAMLDTRWTSIGVSVRNADNAGDYIATVTFKR